MFDTTPLRRLRRVGLAVLCLFLTFGSLGDVRAGGGPENVFLVVNPQRVDSLTIANHYTSLRQIPSSNVFYLGWTGAMDVISIDVFRSQILEPILTEISRRKLDSQIDYVVYSSGYPFAVDFSSDLPSTATSHTGKWGSLTGLTYLHSLVREKDISYAFSLQNTRSNNYFGTAPLAFDGQSLWSDAGDKVGYGGRPYLLSVMLGYTDGRGNSVDEVIDYLRRGTMADGTSPSGTIYLMRVDGEVRSTTRHDAFPQVLAALRQANVSAEIVDGVLPIRKQDVMGAVIGKHAFHWEKTRSQILPGAICEHLTSFGGDLRSGAKQSPFTEHLRYGAIGSSGTVAEPYALQEKFPHPWMHVHYAHGLSMAESFYRSLASPYQLLIVGDPLCQPWARRPEVIVNGVKSGSQVGGLLVLEPEASDTVPVQAFRLFLDGRLIEECRPGDRLQIDTTKIGDGYHELRIVGIANSLAASQGRLLLPIDVNNHGREITATVKPSVSDSPSQLRFQLSAPGASTIYVFHNRRPMGRVQGSRGSVAVETETLGRGPIEVMAVGVNREDNGKVFARPVDLIVREPNDPVGG